MPERYNAGDRMPEGVLLLDRDTGLPVPALAQAGLLDSVNAMMEHPGTPLIVKLAWTDALEFRRHSPTVLALSGALGMSSAQLDALFISAAQIEA